jgi:hypothetical protein
MVMLSYLVFEVLAQDLCVMILEEHLHVHV